MTDDCKHRAAYEKTGFWGSQGAGCILFAQETKRFLIPLRSDHVQQPHTYGTIGGAINETEDPGLAAQREVSEECGFHGRVVSLMPLYVYSTPTRDGSEFRYHNFLMIIEKEFTARPDWETHSFHWVSFDELLRLEPKHYGLQALLDNARSILEQVSQEQST
jgi:8-oxo-dGTP pyrophosphatase MutT (NUDIX family)